MRYQSRAQRQREAYYERLRRERDELAVEVRRLRRRLAGERVLRWAASSGLWTASWDRDEDGMRVWVWRRLEVVIATVAPARYPDPNPAMPEATAELITIIAQDPDCPTELRLGWRDTDA